MKSEHSDSRYDDLNLAYERALQASAGAELDDGIEPLSRRQALVSWICRLIAAAIMVETLYFKFTGQPESVWIFTRMHMESWWRYGQGVWELVAAILLFIPSLTWLGAMLTLGAMGAAIMSHLGVLGISVQNDHGLLFGMACVTFLSALTVLWIHQRTVPNISRLDDYHG
ncbi:MAG TPA: DoxX family protein [Candidatus Limnocylindria bacterium]|nr:DoxX family protein [Candidatus Limnocylindria bacterium]